MRLITISLGRNILDEESRERERMRLYAKELDAFYVIVLSRKEHGYFPIQHEGSLHIYATHSLLRMTMLLDAFIIIRRIMRGSDTNFQWTISAQDPLEIGWLSWLLSKVLHTRLHVQVHGDYVSSNNWVGYSLLRYVRRFLALILLRRAPRIRVVSERIKQSLVTHGVPSAALTVLPIRPELESFLAVTHTVQNSARCTFLYIGRLAPEKDIPKIIDAFALVYKDNSTVRLRIVGDGSERKRIAEMVEALACKDAITLMPWTENVPEEMARADVFLLASRHEAYALTLVEAMAAGLPLVTTDVGCVGEVVHDGVQGLVVHDDCVSTYADAMKRMSTDKALRESCSREGKKTAEKLAQVTKEEYAYTWVQAIISSH